MKYSDIARGLEVSLYGGVKTDIADADVKIEMPFVQKTTVVKRLWWKFWRPNIKTTETVVMRQCDVAKIFYDSQRKIVVVKGETYN